MFTIAEKPKEKPMNYTVIDYYMEEHDFLPCDKQKIRKFIDTENAIRTIGHRSVDI